MSGSETSSEVSESGKPIAAVACANYEGILIDNTTFSEAIVAAVQTEVDTPALRLLNELFTRHGHEIRLAGGVVRDLLLGIKPHDIDLCTTATPTDMAGEDGTEGGFLRERGNGISKVIPTGLQHGTVTVLLNHEQYEITTLRIDTDHDGRHCDVEFTTDWKLDAERRDLTINAMMLGLDMKLYDFFEGRTDLAAFCVRFVGEPKQRLEEDYLRILRYFRFHGRISQSGEHDAPSIDAISQCAHGLKGISGERIRSEMMKIIGHPQAAREVAMMRDSGVLDNIMLLQRQNSHLDEFNRVMCFTKDPTTRLTALLDNLKEAEIINGRWRLTKKELAQLQFIIEHRNAGHDLAWAKSCATWAALSGAPEKKDIIAELLRYSGKCNDADILDLWEVPICPVNGGDLIKAGFPKGKKLGAKLNELKEQWIASDFTLTREELLAKLPPPSNA